MKKIFNFKTLLFVISAILLASVDWRIFIGVWAFGWMMNLENDTKLCKECNQELLTRKE